MKSYTRVRVAAPSKFKKGSFRTIDPGRPSHTKLVIGRLKTGPHAGKTRVQAILYKKARK